MMPTLLRWGRLLPFVFLLLVPTFRLSAQTSIGAGDRVTRFLENRGQVVDMNGALRPDILFTGGGPGVQLYLRRTGISYVFYTIKHDSTIPSWLSGDGSELLRPGARGLDQVGDPSQAVMKGRRIDMEFVGANANAVVEREGISSDRVNYYLAQCPDGITGLASWRTIVYREIYPSIDLVIHGTSTGLKYDFIVHPGGDPSVIRLRYSGAEGIFKTSNGTIRVTSSEGNLEEGRPYSYQVVRDGSSSIDRLAPVASVWKINGDEIGFRVGKYDRSRDLVIDPTLIWGTYYGGSSTENPVGNGAHAVGLYGQGIAADRSGNVVVDGTTRSTDFPVTPGAFQNANLGVTDAFLVSFTPNGIRRWATYIGGTNMDRAGGLALDSVGCIYYSIQTQSADFPVTPGVIQPTIAGLSDIAIVQFDSSGLRSWGTYYGGSQSETAGGISVDRRRNIAFCGHTYSRDLPVSPGAFRAASVGVATDAFVVVLDSSGRRLWATYVGGSGGENSGWIGSDTSGNVVFTGSTQSTDFPVSPGASQQTLNRGTNTGNLDVFVISFDPLGRRNWATYIGGYYVESAGGIGIDLAGHVYLGGSTGSNDFPVTSGAIQPTYGGGQVDCFFAKLSPSGRLIWSTYYGGEHYDYVDNIAIGHDGSPLFIGTSRSITILKTVNNMQSTPGGDFDLIMGEFDTSGSVVWDSYFGGTRGERSGTICMDHMGGFYIAGETLSWNLPFVGAFQPALNNPYGYAFDLLIARFCNSLAPTAIAGGSTSICQGDSVRLSAPPGYSRYRWTPTNDTTRHIIVKTTGDYSVRVEDNLGCFGSSAALRVVVNPLPQPVLRTSGPTTICVGDSVILRINYPGALRYLWTTGSTADSIVVRTSGSYSVLVTDMNGCIASTPEHVVNVTALPPRPDIAAGDTVWVCPDSLAYLDMGAGYTRVEWNTSDTTRFIRVGPGRYWGRVFNLADCLSFSDTIVVVPYARREPKIAYSGSLQICPGDSLRLDAGGTYPAYRWSTGARGRYLFVRTAGTYSVMVTDTNGCQVNSDSVQITLAPATSASIAALGATEFCDGDSVQLESGTDVFAGYRWSTGDTSARITVRSGGLYRLRGVTQDGCISDPDSILVTVHPRPTVQINGPTTVCRGSTQIYQVIRQAGYLYQWTISGDGTPQSRLDSNGVVVKWGANGSATVTVRVTNSLTGCQATASVGVTLGSELVPTVTASSFVVCPGDSVELDAGDGYVSYLWSTGATTRTIHARQGISYTVTVRDADDCRGTSQSVQVTERSAPKPIVQASGSTSMCPGDSLELDAGGGYVSYLWSTGATTRRLMVHRAGTYNVGVRDTSTCWGRSDDVVVREYPLTIPTVRAVGPTTISGGDSVVLEVVEPYSMYQWSTGETTPRIVVKTTGDYSVTVVDSNGCRGASNGGVRITVRPSGGIDTVIAHVKVGSASGAPGDRVMIPLRLTAENLDTTRVRGYGAVLRYNRTMLLPTGATPMGVVDGSDRVITIAQALPLDVTTGGDLARLEFIVLLGNAEATLLQLADFTLEGSPVSATITDGEFRLTGLCHNGGTRLVNAEGSFGLKSVRPNPVSGACEVEYEVIEIGMTRVYVVDLLGRRVAELQSGSIEPGRYLVRFDAGILGSGIYTIVLETPTQRGSATLQVVR